MSCRNRKFKLKTIIVIIKLSCDMVVFMILLYFKVKQKKRADNVSYLDPRNNLKSIKAKKKYLNLMCSHHFWSKN